MTRIIALASTLALATLLAACDEKPHSTPSQEPTPQRPATALTVTPTPTVATPVIRDEDIPTLADFEEEAEREITPANMEAHLARIEKDLTTTSAPREGSPLPGQQGTTAPGQQGTTPR